MTMFFYRLLFIIIVINKNKFNSEAKYINTTNFEPVCQTKFCQKIGNNFNIFLLFLFDLK